MNDSQRPPTSLGENGIRYVTWALLYILPLGIALLPIFDEDVWWHIRAGQWMLENRTIPATDPFSQLGLESNAAWIAYSWLFEVIVAGFFQAMGPAGIVLFRGLLTLAVVLALHRLVGKREPRFVVAAGVTGLGVLAMAPLLTERPWLFSILFSILTLDVILNLRAGVRSRAVWLLPLLYVVWANLHIQFVYGLFLLGLGCACPVLDRFFRRDGESEFACRLGSREWRQLVFLTAACAAATLVTPYHVRLYGVVLHYATQKAPLRHVFEMQALEFRSLWDWAVLALFCVAAFALARRRRLSAFDVLLVVACAWFAFRSRRDAWFMALGAAAVVVPLCRSKALATSFLLSWRQALVLAGGVCPLLLFLWTTRVTEAGIAAHLEKHYPVHAAAFVKSHAFHGPLYNSYNWGGYLMLHLPGLPVGMDGRANLYGDARLDRSMDTWLGHPGWDRDPDLKAANVIIFEAWSPLVSLLRQDPHFTVAHDDATAVVFVRADPGLLTASD